MSKGLLDVTLYAKAVNSYLTTLFPSSSHNLYNLAKEIVLTGGRRIRAILALLGCEIICGEYKRALPMAAAYELAHAAALMQDDILDKAGIRGGRPTTWAEHGISRAILTMDVILFSIPQVIGEYVRSGLPRARIYDLLKMIGDSSRDAALGEYLDLEIAERHKASVQDYLEMARLKTGSLLAAPSACGAIVGGGTAKQVRALHRFGEVLGTAYQMVDDILDVVGSEDRIGKPVFNDLRNGKLNIVIILALEALQEKSRKTDFDFVRSLRGKEMNGEELSKARKIVTDSGSLKRAGELVLRTLGEAQRSLEPLEDSEAKRKLIELSSYLARRYE